MATKKISGLPVASALDGTELVPVVQDSTTAKTTAANIAALSGFAPGTADGVLAMGLVIPSADTTEGILIKGRSATWGDIGLSAGGSADYGKGQVLAYHRYDATSTDPNDVLLFRLDKTGGIGAAGGIHNAYGLRQAAGWTPASQAEWIQLFADVIGQVISAPTVSASATWTHKFLQCLSDRSGVATELFAVDQYGIVNGPNCGPSPFNYRLFDHFETADTQATTLGRIGGSAGFTLLSGTAAQVTQIGLTAGGPKGIAAASTGTDTTGYCAVSFLHEPVFFTAASTVIAAFGARIKIPLLSDGTNTFSVRAGMVNSFTTTLATDGLTFRLPNASNWLAVNRRGGTETAVDTGVAGSAGAWVNLKIKYAAGGDATYYINGALVATISTNKPTDAIGLLATVGIVKSAGTTARSVYVDAMNLDVADDIDLEQILA